MVSLKCAPLTVLAKLNVRGGEIREYTSSLSFRMRYTPYTDTMSRNLVGYSIDYKGVNYRLNSSTVFSDRNWIEFNADNSGITVV